MLKRLNGVFATSQRKQNGETVPAHSIHENLSLRGEGSPVAGNGVQQSSVVSLGKFACRGGRRGVRSGFVVWRSFLYIACVQYFSQRSG